MIRLAGESELSPEDEKAACEMFDSIRTLAQSSQENVTALGELASALEYAGRMSRDLRRPLNKIQDGLRRVSDGQGIMDEWVRTIEETPIECPLLRSQSPGAGTRPRVMWGKLNPRPS